MAEHDIADAIVTRRFELAGGRHVEIYVWKPVEDIKPEGSAFRCDCRIVGLGDDKVKSIFGVDAVQALTLALQWMGMELDGSDAFKAGDLTFFGDRELGLPLFDGVKPGVEGYGVAQLLSHATNYAVVQLPGRRFPGVVFQGDSLSSWLNEIEEIETNLTEKADLIEAREGLGYIRQRLNDLLIHYEAVCRGEGLGLPYMKPRS